MYGILWWICALLFVATTVLTLLMLKNKKSRLLPLLIFCGTLCIVCFLYLNGVNTILKGL